jgi:hypothetical protein
MASEVTGDLEIIDDARAAGSRIAAAASLLPPPSLSISSQEPAPLF